MTFYSSLRISPGAWVFQRDMILKFPLITDLQLINQHRQVIIDEYLRRANFRWRSCDYKMGDEFLILLDNPSTSRLSMTMYEVLILLIKYMPMVYSLFNELCILRNELFFIASNLFMSRRFSLGVAGRVSDPVHQYRYIQG